MIAFAAYLACIVGANVAITIWGFVPVGFGLMAPAGVFFAGLALGARDWLQESKGRWWTVAAIVLGAGLSAFLSPALAVASGVAFGVSETLDMLVYSPLKSRGWVLTSIAASNTAGLIADSAIFLYLAFGSLDYIAGQIVGKTEATILTIIAVAIWRSHAERRKAILGQVHA